MKKQRRWFITAQFFALAWSLDATLWPYAFKLLIDKMIAFQGDKSVLWIYLMPVLFFWLGLWLTIELLFRLQGFLLAYIVPRFCAHVRLAMYEYVTGHSYEFFANNFAGNLSNKISDMVESATHASSRILTLFVPVLVALCIAITIFATINSLLALFLLSFAILHLGICLFTAKKLQSFSATHAESRSTLTGKIVDSFTNIITVKLFAKQSYERWHTNQYQMDEQQKHQRSQFMVEKVKVALGISSFFFPGVLMTVYMIYCWQQDLITTGDLVLIFNTTSNITTLLWIVSMELPNFFKEIGICQQALTIIKAKHDVSTRRGAKDLIVTQGEISFQKVSFHYVKNTPIFTNLSVTINSGEKVGLVGFSGSGKSTFVNLLMRFYDIQSGKITIDGNPIDTVTLKSLRTKISMIPQNPSLFHRSIRENICYGNPKASEAEIRSAAQHAHCEQFIKQIPEQYDALVGERGIKLSGGQRQRIAIARAIIEDAPILVLDEATSALDSITEKHIQDALHYLMKNRTTLVIAHRLSTLSEMDRILVFDQGHLIEEGDHHTLLAKNGHYATMWKLQAGGFLPEKPSTDKS